MTMPRHSAPLVLALLLLTSSLLPAATNELRWCYEDSTVESPRYWNYSWCQDNGGSTIATVSGDLSIPVSNVGYGGGTSIALLFNHDGIDTGAQAYLSTRSTVPYQGNEPLDWTDADSTFKDVSACSNLVFWIKPDGNSDPSINISISIQHSGGDLPGYIPLTNYGVNFSQASWQKVSVPVGDLPWGSFSQRSNIKYIIFMASSLYNGSFSCLIDDVRFITFSPPSVPVNVVSAGETADSIKIEWGNVAGEEGYKVYTYTLNDPLSASVLARLPADTTNFVQTNILTQNWRFYWVTATNAGGDSAFSTVTSNKVLSSGTPSAPVVLSNRVVSPRQAYLFWDQTVGAMGYKVYRSRTTNSASASNIAVIVSPFTVSFLDTGLSPSTTWHYWLTATNASGGESARSVRITFTTTATLLPPVIRSATAVSTNAVALGWSAVPHATSYTLFSSPYDDPDLWDYRAGFPSSATNGTNAGLALHSGHYFWVRQYVNGEASAFSPSAYATTFGKELKWCFDTSSNYWPHPDENSVFAVNGWGEEIRSLTRNVWVRIQSGYFDREFLPVDHADPYEGSSALKFEIVNHEQVSFNSISVYIGANTNNDGAPPLDDREEKKGKNIKGYDYLRFWVKGDGSGRFCSVRLRDYGAHESLDDISITKYIDDLFSREWQQVEIPLSDFSFNFGLGRTNIHFVVFRVDKSWPSGSWTFYVDNVSFSRADTVPRPARPVFSMVKAVNTNEIRVYWKQAQNTVTYTLYRSTNADPSSATAVAGLFGSTVRYADTGLVQGTKYYYWLRGFNASGASPFSRPVDAVTRFSTDVPLSPYNLSARIVNVYRANISWEDLPNETGYRIYRNSVDDWASSALVASSGSNVNWFLDRDLEQGQPYYFWVVALNANGASTPSEPVFVRTGTVLKEGQVKVAPNVLLPDRAEASIIFDSPAAGEVELSLYDTAGDLVWSHREYFGAGPGVVVWDRKNDRGNDTASGLYIVYVRGQGWSSRTKFILMK